MAAYAHHQGLIVSAGHGLKYDNTKSIAMIKEIEELNIGHSIISRAVFVGLEQAVREMISLVRHQIPSPKSQVNSHVQIEITKTL
jgi:pyridoxine 5-phosphate synthase